MPPDVTCVASVQHRRHKQSSEVSVRVAQPACCYCGDVFIPQLPLRRGKLRFRFV